MYAILQIDETLNELLVDIIDKSDFSTYTIVAIGLECGFNSKSTFYTAFKKFTNVTPSEFKEK